jgi:hypothetical protein
LKNFGYGCPAPIAQMGCRADWLPYSLCVRQNVAEQAKLLENGALELHGRRRKYHACLQKALRSDLRESKK